MTGYLTAQFCPQPDITAFELAQLVLKAYTLVGDILITQEQLDAVPPEVRRHLKVSP